MRPEPVEPAPIADDEEPPSVETLNPIEALTAAEHDAHIPGVDVAALPGPDDFVKIPGVDGGDFPVPDPVETTVLDAIAKPPVIAAEAVASAPVSEVQPAVTNEARRSTEIPTQTARAPPIESHRVSHPDAKMFVIKDGSKRAATQVGHEAATKVGMRNPHSNGNKSTDDNWIEVQPQQHCRGQHTPLILNAKGTCIMRGHPTGGSPPTGNFPIVNNVRFYTSEVTSILCNLSAGHSSLPSILRDTSNTVNAVISKSVKFEDAPKTTNTSAHKRTRSSLVPKGNHRSVLELVISPLDGRRTVLFELIL